MRIQANILSNLDIYHKSRLFICLYNVWFFEEGIKNGSIARNFSDLLCCTQFCGDYHIKAINDKFVKQMSVSEALHELKLDDDGMVNTITKNLKEKN